MLGKVKPLMLLSMNLLNLEILSGGRRSVCRVHLRLDEVLDVSQLLAARRKQKLTGMIPEGKDRTNTSISTVEQLRI